MDMMANKKIKQINTQLSENANHENIIGWELSSKIRKKQCVISFVSDDGKIDDYTWSKPIFQAEGVPLCVAISTGLVGQTNYCTKEQLLELQGLGWEMLSHTVNHVDVSLITTQQADTELKNSRDWLNANGLRCKNLAFPFGGYNFATQQIAKKYYRSSRTILKGFNSIPIESQELKSYWFSTAQTDTDSHGNTINTFAYYKQAIDDAVLNKDYLIISFHSADAKLGNYGSLITQVIQYAKTQAPVLTVNDALDLIGNIVDVGIYSRLNNYDGAFVIGCDGKTSDYIKPLFVNNLGVKKNSPIMYTQTLDATTIALFQQFIGSVLKTEFQTSTDGQFYMRHALSNGTMENVISFANDNRIEVYKTLDLNGNLLVSPSIILAQGATASRPTPSASGQMFYDTTLGKPIWWNGSAWKDATGTTV